MPVGSAQYQPLWTFVGSGLKTFDESKMAMSDVMPENAQWIKNSVASFNPTKNTVVLANGESVRKSKKKTSTGHQGFLFLNPSPDVVVGRELEGDQCFFRKG